MADSIRMSCPISSRRRRLPLKLDTLMDPLRRDRFVMRTATDESVV
jgi:hypothetical protein